jgi:hypothetical protein
MAAQAPNAPSPPFESVGIITRGVPAVASTCPPEPDGEAVGDTKTVLPDGADTFSTAVAVFAAPTVVVNGSVRAVVKTEAAEDAPLALIGESPVPVEKRNWATYNIGAEKVSTDRVPKDGEVAMPDHESVEWRAIGVFLITSGQRSKLEQKTALWAGICLLPLLAMTCLPQVAAAGFITTRSFPAGSAPVSVAVGDFNGDGIPDLAVLDLPTDAGQFHGLSVLLGRVDGSFGPPRPYPVGSNSQALALGDFNGDGRIDILVSNTAEATLSLFLGNGDGTFHQARPVALGGASTGIVVGDFNGDGIPDLAVAIENSASDHGTISILLGNGDGTFRAQPSLDVGNFPWSVVAADCNGDGILDLAVSNSNLDHSTQKSTVSILLGNGDGTFQAAVNYPVGADPRALVAGDFNGDGFLDLAVSNIGDSTLSILLGNGDGTFQAALSYPSSPPADDSTGYFYTLAVADFNSDGHLDLAVTGLYGVAIWLGQGDGSFRIGHTYHVGMGSVAVGDFNQDGHADLAITNAEANAVRIVLGRGDGTFLAGSSFATGWGILPPSPWAISMAMASRTSRPATFSSTPARWRSGWARAMVPFRMRQACRRTLLRSESRWRISTATARRTF